MLPFQKERLAMQPIPLNDQCNMTKEIPAVEARILSFSPRYQSSSLFFPHPFTPFFHSPLHRRHILRPTLKLTKLKCRRALIQ